MAVPLDLSEPQMADVNLLFNSMLNVYVMCVRNTTFMNKLLQFLWTFFFKYLHLCNNNNIYCFIKVENNSLCDNLDKTNFKQIFVHFIIISNIKNYYYSCLIFYLSSFMSC